MILHASRLRFFLTVPLLMDIGFFVGFLPLRDPNILELLIITVGLIISNAIIILLVPAMKLDTILKEDVLILPGWIAFSQPIEIPLSEIDLEKSKIGRFGEGRIITITGKKHIISTKNYDKKDIQKLFDEIERLQSTQND